MSLSRRTRRCTATRQLPVSGSEARARRALASTPDPYGPTHLVLCHFKHAQFGPRILEPEVVLVKVGLLVGGRLQVFDLADPDPAPREDLSHLAVALASQTRPKGTPIPGRRAIGAGRGRRGGSSAWSARWRTLCCGCRRRCRCRCRLRWSWSARVLEGASCEHDLGRKARRSDRRDRRDRQVAVISAASSSFVLQSLSRFEHREIRAAYRFTECSVHIRANGHKYIPSHAERRLHVKAIARG